MITLVEEKIICKSWPGTSLASKAKLEAAIFGFFDLDAIFSSSFILLLAAIINSADTSDPCQFPFLNPSPGIKEGIQLLEYLASYQNHAAKARKDQIQNLRECLPSLIQDIRPTEAEGETPKSPHGGSINVSVESPCITHIERILMCIRLR